MARWRVTAKHYIHAEQYGQPTEWIREETNRDTGRTFRKAMVVPMLIDPEDPGCVNRFTGQCVVATKGSEQPGDIVMFGPPTPDMEPLDEEATKLSDTERPKWVSPIDSLPMQIGEEFASGLLRQLEQQLSQAKAPAPQAAVSLAGASSSEVADLKALLAAQQEQINKLLGSSVQPDVDLSDPPPPPPKVVAPLRRGA